MDLFFNVRARCTIDFKLRSTSLSLFKSYVPMCKIKWPSFSCIFSFIWSSGHSILTTQIFFTSILNSSTFFDILRSLRCFTMLLHISHLFFSFKFLLLLDFCFYYSCWLPNDILLLALHHSVLLHCYLIWI